MKSTPLSPTVGGLLRNFSDVTRKLGNMSQFHDTTSDSETVNLTSHADGMMTHVLNDSMESAYSDMEHAFNDIDSFFDTYYSQTRFIVETTFAAVAVLLNSVALLLARNAVGGPQAIRAYHTLFINLTIINTISSVLAWTSNNVLYLFEEQLMDMLMDDLFNMCKLFLYMLTGSLVSCATGVISSLTMLGFTVVQCIAVFRPLHHLTIIRKKRVVAFIVSGWLLTILITSVPVIVLYVKAHTEECDAVLVDTVIQVVVVDSDIGICLVGVIHLLAIIFCVRIYTEIRRLNQRLSRFRFDQDLKTQKRIFVTTLIFLMTLTLFFLPYSLVFVVTLNISDSSFMHHSALIYYMNLLPYLKFMLDPVIYGVRMREMHNATFRVSYKLGLHKCSCMNCDGTHTTRVHRGRLHHVGSFSFSQRHSTSSAYM